MLLYPCSLESVVVLIRTAWICVAANWSKQFGCWVHANILKFCVGSCRLQGRAVRGNHNTKVYKDRTRCPLWAGDAGFSSIEVWIPYEFTQRSIGVSYNVGPKPYKHNHFHGDMNGFWGPKFNENPNIVIKSYQCNCEAVYFPNNIGLVENWVGRYHWYPLFQTYPDIMLSQVVGYVPKENLCELSHYIPIWLVVWSIFIFPYIGNFVFQDIENNHPNWLPYFSEG